MKYPGRSGFPCESLGVTHPHVAPPRLRWVGVADDHWYAGIPFTLRVTARNQTQKVLTESSIKVTFEMGGKEVMRKRSGKKQIDLAPGAEFGFSMIYTSPGPGDISVQAVCSYRANENPVASMLTASFRIIPAVNVTTRLDGPFFYYGVVNTAPFTLTGVRVAVDQGEEMALAERLGLQEGQSGFVESAEVGSVTVVWDTPFARMCKQTFTPEKKVKTPQPFLPIGVSMMDSPKIVPMLKAFSVTLVLRNNTGNVATGKVSLLPNQNTMCIQGKNQIQFEGIEKDAQQEFSVEFVALREGCIKYPTLEIRVDGCPPFSHSLDEKVVVIGTEE